MKNTKLVWTFGLLAFVIVFAVWLQAADTAPLARWEYVTIRWAGKENTHIVRPGGQVEFVGAELRKAAKPDRADERSFYMNLVLNGLSKEGYEVAGMTTDEIVMRRNLAK
jgi:hypothetical protein